MKLENLLMAFLLVGGATLAFAEGDIYIVTTPNGDQHSYHYPVGAPSAINSMPPVKISGDEADCAEGQDSDSGYHCNFLSQGKFDTLSEDYRKSADKQITDYKISLEKKLAEGDNPPAAGEVIPELSSLKQQIDQTLDAWGTEFKVNEAFMKKQRLLLSNQAKERSLKEGDARFKPAPFNRLLMSENPKLNVFANFRMVNGASLFPHGVSLPPSPLLITSGEMLSVVRTVLDFTPAGMGLMVVEAVWGRSLTPPFEPLTEVQQSIVLGAVFIGGRGFWNKAAAELGGLEKAFEKYLGAGVANSGAMKQMMTIIDSSHSLWYYSPVNKGALHELSIGVGTVADTFRSSSYIANLTKTDVKLYRVYSEGMGDLGAFWSRVKPTGPMQATVDAAIHPNFNNNAAKWIEVTVPANELIYEGVAGAQKLKLTNSSAVVEVLGGGNQVYMTKRIPRSWISDSGELVPQ